MTPDRRRSDGSILIIPRMVERQSGRFFLRHDPMLVARVIEHRRQWS